MKWFIEKMTPKRQIRQMKYYQLFYDIHIVIVPKPRVKVINEIYKV